MGPEEAFGSDGLSSSRSLRIFLHAIQKNGAHQITHNDTAPRNASVMVVLHSTNSCEAGDGAQVGCRGVTALQQSTVLASQPLESVLGPERTTLVIDS